MTRLCFYKLHLQYIEKVLLLSTPVDRGCKVPTSRALRAAVYLSLSVSAMRQSCHKAPAERQADDEKTLIAKG